MNTVGERRREHHEIERPDPERAQASSTPATSAATSGAAGSSPDARLHETLDRLPVSGDYAVFLTQLRAAPGAGATSRAPAQVDTARTALVSPTLLKGNDVAVQQRLDAFRDRFSGPYDVAGTEVSARPMFRMNTPDAHNAKKMLAHAPELAQICVKAGIGSAAGPARFGRCSPEQLVKVTQALIDAGKLPPADKEHANLENRIRGMQWEWGIGVDCAGYTQQAAAAAHGDAGKIFKANLMGDIFSGMMGDKRFESVDPTRIRPGDVIHLDAQRQGDVGHNVICHAHAILSEEARAALLRESSPTGAEGKDFLRGAGPFHTFEVDSSWGAGDGDMVGGFRRDTWLYDESTFTWATYPSGNRTKALEVYELTGPQDELFGGAFRPRGAR